MSLITLDTDRISQLFAQSTKAGIDAEAEQSLLEVLELKEKLDTFLSTLEKEIEKTALEVEGEYWSGSKGDKIKIEYRAYGAIYSPAETIDKVGDEFKVAKFVPERTDYSLNTKAIEEYVLKHKDLPIGVKENDRKKRVSIKKI